MTAAFALGVVDAFNSGLGGVAVLVYHAAATGESAVIDGTAPLPAAVDPATYPLLSAEERAGIYHWRAVAGDLTNTGHLSVAVPGAPACLCDAQERYGRLTREDVLAPAIALARDGFELDGYVAFVIAMQAQRLWRFPESRRVFFRADGSPLGPGMFLDTPERLVQPDLARTLQAIQREGRDGFYRGTTAELIAAEVQAHGGFLTTQDLATYRARSVEPAFADYGEVRVVYAPDNNGMPTVIEALNILEDDRLGELGSGSTQALHLIIEAQRLAFADRFRHLGDPQFAPVPRRALVSKEYAALRRAQLDSRAAANDVAAGDPWPLEAAPPPPSRSGRGGDGMTTHVSVVDAHGSLAGLTSTLGGHFGSAVVAADTGVVLNNGTTWFDPEPGSIVSRGPGTRILTASSPALVLRNERPFMAVGAPGGHRVISTVLQSLVNVLDHGLGPQAAVETARVHAEGRVVEVDRRLPPRVLDGLRRRGHELISPRESNMQSFFARPNAVVIDATGARRGGVTQFGPSIAIAV